MANSRTRNAGRRHSYADVAAWAIVLVGLVLRLAQYASNRSLWLDEAALALNLVSRSFTGLTQPLGYAQGAPIAFLFLEKAVLQMLGNSEYALRLLPLTAGCASVWFMYRLSNRCLAVPDALLALSLFAFGPHLIYYASEVKQYASDVAIALLLLLMAAKHFDAEQETRQFFILGIVGALGLWFSHPALFLAGGVGLTLALHYGTRRDWHGLRRLVAVGFWWGANLFALYLVSLRPLAGNHQLLDYWRSSFVPWPPWQNPYWFVQSALLLFMNPVGLLPHLPVGYATAVSVLLLLFLMGCWSMLLKKWRWGVLLVTPLILTMVASTLSLYPFRGRLLLFTVPILLLLLVQGLKSLRLVLARVSWLSWGIWGLLALGMLVYPVSRALGNLIAPEFGEHIRPVVAYIDDNRQDDDDIYVYYGAGPAFKYYAPAYGIDAEDYAVGRSGRDNPDRYLVDIDHLRGSERVWVVFSHVHVSQGTDERLLMLQHLDREGQRLGETIHASAYGYLYDLSDCP